MLADGPIIAPAGWVLTGESCQPANQAIDPDEIVTVDFSLQNIGTADTIDLVATLLETGGIASPGAAQDYGVITASGPPVTRPFSLTAKGDCGGTLTATLQLTDGPTDLGSVQFTLRIGNVPLSESFDASAELPAGWTSAVAVGQVALWYVTTDEADSRPNSVFAIDPDSATDNMLISPPVAIMSANNRLTFRHHYSLEADVDPQGRVAAAFDGGVLEISIANGPFADILDAGGSFLTGGYAGQLASDWGNPLGGRMAWSGDSGGFITTTVELPPAAIGQAIQLRWRLGSDNSVAWLGWYVDTLSVRAVLADEYFDRVTAPALPSGWTATVAAGLVPPWNTSTIEADTGPNSVYTRDPGFVADNWLDSPPVVITSLTPQLVFRHHYNLEPGYDGGVLELSIAGRPFRDILTGIGNFEYGGYTGVIPADSSNPLAGRSAWTGDSGGFITTVVNLPVAVVGQTIQLRWRMGSDESYGAGGWYVDTFSVVGGCCMPVNSIGDFDGDGDVDQDDFGLFQACLTASDTPVTNLRCQPGRMDQDDDVDLFDLALFNRCISGSDVPANPDCRNQ